MKIFMGAHSFPGGMKRALWDSKIFCERQQIRYGIVFAVHPITRVQTIHILDPFDGSPYPPQVLPPNDRYHYIRFGQAQKR